VGKHPVTIDLEPWRFSERPRVLIEHPDPESALEVAAAVRNAGCGVAICRGPDAAAEPPTRCPLHALEPCAVVEGADVVVTSLDFEDADALSVLQGLRTRYPSTPLVVQATVRTALDLESGLADCTVLPVTATPAEIASAVQRALALVT
jgi:hypothetical protein